MRAGTCSSYVLAACMSAGTCPTLWLLACVLEQFLHFGCLSCDGAGDVCGVMENETGEIATEMIMRSCRL